FMLGAQKGRHRDAVLLLCLRTYLIHQLLRRAEVNHTLPKMAPPPLGDAQGDEGFAPACGHLDGYVRLFGGASDVVVQDFGLIAQQTRDLPLPDVIEHCDGILDREAASSIEFESHGELTGISGIHDSSEASESALGPSG